MSRPRIDLVAGARPNFMKIAPLVRALRADGRLDFRMVHTGQHRDREMNDVFFEELGIPRPDVVLEAGGATHAALTGSVMLAYEKLCQESPPAAVLVVGDVNSTLACALTAKKLHLPVAHVEAGLRSGDLHSPFPEKANRRLVAQISDLHLAPTPVSGANLIREGVSPHRIVVTGNTVIDALQWAGTVAADYGADALADLDDDPRRIVLASAHRRESWRMLPQIGAALRRIAREQDVRVVVPLHRNPVVREALLPEIADQPGLTIVDPLPYLNFVKLMRRADIIVSDSSGAEEEGPALGKPTLVLREITERPEAVAVGTAQLVGRTTEGVADSVIGLLRDPVHYERMAGAANPYGDGHASVRTVAALAHYFGEGPAVQPFVPGSTPTADLVAV